MARCLFSEIPAASVFRTILFLLAGFSCMSMNQEYPSAKVMNAHDIPEIYPFLGKNGLYGYADSSLQLYIRPQYKEAGLFNEQGYAMAQMPDLKWGIINTANKVILPFEHKNIRLYTLDDYTLAEVQKTYQANYRFWEWKFLPGLNLLGGGSNDKRLFDTKVSRMNTEALVLIPKNNQHTIIRPVTNTSVTTRANRAHFFEISTLLDNRVVIDGTLYQIRPSGAKKIADHITDILNYGTRKSPNKQRFARAIGKALQVIDTKGKAVKGSEFQRLDSLSFLINGQEATIQLGQHVYERKATVYQNKRGERFIYPDFKKALPDSIQFPAVTDTSKLQQLLRNATVICSIDYSPYFLAMSYQGHERGYLFFDSNGKGYSRINYNGPFTLTLPSGHIIWPLMENLLKNIILPEHMTMVHGQHMGAGHYLVALEDTTKDLNERKASVFRGIWDKQERRWLVSPKYYYIKPMDDKYRFWAFQKDKDGRWGVIDTKDRQRVVIMPKFNYINESGMVTEIVADKRITYLLEVSSHKEFYEK